MEISIDEDRESLRLKCVDPPIHKPTIAGESHSNETFLIRIKLLIGMKLFTLE